MPVGNRTAPKHDGIEGARAGLRPLGLPRPLRVRLDEGGEPVEVTPSPRGRAGRRGSRSGTPLAVEGVEEVWRIAEEWWRDTPLRRTYYRVLVDGGRPLTLFHDDVAPSSEDWYEQRY